MTTRAEKLSELVASAWKNSCHNGHENYMRSLSNHSLACDMIDGDSCIADMVQGDDFDSLIAEIAAILPGIIE